MLNLLNFIKILIIKIKYTNLDGTIVYFNKKDYKELKNNFRGFYYLLDFASNLYCNKIISRDKFFEMLNNSIIIYDSKFKRSEVKLCGGTFIIKMAINSNSYLESFEDIKMAIFSCYIYMHHHDDLKASNTLLSIIKDDYRYFDNLDNINNKFNRRQEKQNAN